MTKEYAKEFSKILLAYSEGKTIEYYTGKRWQISDNLIFDGTVKNYRIKPEKKLVPFTFEDRNMFKDRWIKLKGKTWLKRIVTIMNNNIVIFAVDKYEELDFIHISYEELLLNYEFDDKTPCGKYIEE